MPGKIPCLIAAVLLSLAAAHSALAVPFIRVNTLLDENDGAFTNGISLRDAIGVIDPGGRIEFDSNLDGGTIKLLHGHLTIIDSVTIDARSLRCGVTLDAHRSSRHFTINLGPGEDVTLAGLTLIGGLADNDNGGAIRLGSGGAVDLTLIQCALMMNEAAYTSTGGSGGGIHSANTGATITIDSSTFACNRAATNGGGISAANATLTVTNSTFSGNTAERPATTYINSGGAIYLGNGSLQLDHSTIIQNEADFGGALAVYGAGPHPVSHTIFAFNQPYHVSQSAGSVTSNGYNLVDTTISGINAATDLSNTPPFLDALRYTLGKVPTHMPWSSSPAVDSGNPGLVAGTTAPINDPRTMGRIVDGGASGPGVIIDRGAHELQRITIVDTAVDENDGPGVGTGTSLRDAIADLTSGFGGRIEFAYALNGADLRLTLGSLDLDYTPVLIDATSLDKGVNILGPADPNLAEFRVFDLNRSFAFFRNLRIREGFTDGTTFTSESGGGLRLNEESFLRLTECTVRDNQAANGGGLWVGGESVCVLQQSLVESNISAGNSGAVFDETAFGGGFFIDNSVVKLIDSTVTNNSATSASDAVKANGGAFALNGNDARLRLAHSTVAHNRVPSTSANGGGIAIISGNATASATHTILAHNSPLNYDGPSASFVSLDYNLESATDCNFTSTGDLQNTNPQLATLHDYGGKSRCHATLPTSPARNAGNPAIEYTSLAFVFCRHGDQRNVSRIWPNGGTIDIGAYEGGFPQICTFWTWGVETVGEDLKPGGDTDLDTIPDEVEYAMSLNPFALETFNTPSFDLITGRLEGGFQRNAQAKDATITVDLTSDLLTITEIYRFENGTVTNNTGLINETGTWPLYQITVRDPAPTTAIKKFARIGVEITSE